MADEYEVRAAALASAQASSTRELKLAELGSVLVTLFELVLKLPNTQERRQAVQQIGDFQRRLEALMRQRVGKAPSKRAPRARA
jgi:hypothetical protein